MLERAVDAFVRLFYYRLRVEKGDKKFFDVALWIVALIAVAGTMISYSHYVISSIGASCCCRHTAVGQQANV